MDRNTSVTIVISIAMAGTWIFLIACLFLAEISWMLAFPIGFGLTAMLIGFYAGLTRINCAKGKELAIAPNGNQMCL